ncbi:MULTISPECIES: DNA-binding protein [Arthrobacter]|uniref:DNA-binding protein n=1 Tax=Arthrobacter TaxID=1663 RepID=UPI00083368D1|nr:MULTISPECIES: DNA-binding protein [Arthrobacter]UPO76069.1 DNA-binding protein [Arthrobacter sp. Helios]
MSTSLNELPRISAPAVRALGGAGITSLRQLAGIPREDLAQLHGMGPKALNIIDAALGEHGLSLG